LEEWKERKMVECDMSGTPTLVLEHLFHHNSFCEALVIAHNQPALLAETKRVMMRKFPDQSKLLIYFSSTFIMVRTFYPISVGVTCGKFRVLQCRRVFEISETPAGGGSVRLTPKWIPA
jgi:hypothetical protein